MQEKLYTIGEAAAYLRLSRQAVYRLTYEYRATKGRAGLRYEKVGKRGKRIPESALLAQRGDPLSNGHG